MVPLPERIAKLLESEENRYQTELAAGSPGRTQDIWRSPLKGMARMASRLKAEYINGSLKPLEPLDLIEGAVVTIYIEQEESPRERQPSVVELVEQLREAMGEDDRDGVPTDWARNYRHYLYGQPKVNQEGARSLPTQGTG